MANDAKENAHNPLFVLRQHDSPVLSCAFYPSPCNNNHSRLFISGDINGTVIVWDLSLRRALLSFHPVKWAIEQNPISGSSPLSVEGVLAVGFLCSGNISNMKTVPDRNASRDPIKLPEEQSVLPVQKFAGSINEIVSSSLVSKRPLRRRFRLVRDALYQNVDNIKCREIIYFFSQCRNQRLYIWECKLNDEKVSSLFSYTTPHLLHTIQVPQYGFCAVASYCCNNGSTVLAVPHDAQGVVSLWRVSDIEAIGENSSTGRQEPQETSVNPFSSTYGQTSDAPLDTTAIGPHVALDVHEITQQGMEHCTLPDISQSPDDAQVSTFTDSTVDSLLHLYFLGSFCTCKGFKGGTILHIYIRDEHHLSVSFESGHVVLCEYQTPFHGVRQENRGTTTLHREGNVLLRILGIVRAFPEPSMTCLYHGQRILVTSTEGHVHSYRLICHHREITEKGYTQDSCGDSVVSHPKSSEQGESIHFFTAWQNKFPKGLGSAILQDDFAVLGCWDHSLRVLDARTGEVLSTLPFHMETVNSVCIAPSAVAMEASFGFDPREPRCYQYQPRMNESSTDGLHENNTGVYIFASASKDGCIALWRVDFFALLERERVAGKFSSKSSMLTKMLHTVEIG
ncbi:unnamed protein product [Phytomonas sp. EM1]|nr:unnamed protein product [Phytomonas sp. EM1]|eukprot:CCW63905.1 unnamed protein product [Phytomonas sp. isolate EM1]